MPSNPCSPSKQSRLPTLRTSRSHCTCAFRPSATQAAATSPPGSATVPCISASSFSASSCDDASDPTAAIVMAPLDPKITSLSLVKQSPAPLTAEAPPGSPTDEELGLRPFVNGMNDINHHICYRFQQDPPRPRHLHHPAAPTRAWPTFVLSLQNAWVETRLSLSDRFDEYQLSNTSTVSSFNIRVQALQYLSLLGPLITALDNRVQLLGIGYTTSTPPMPFPPRTTSVHPTTWRWVAPLLAPLSPLPRDPASIVHRSTPIFEALAMSRSQPQLRSVGTIDWLAFVTMMAPLTRSTGPYIDTGPDTNADLKVVFKLFDKDGDGTIVAYDRYLYRLHLRGVAIK
ncbi:hypothetical protein D9619_011959 [Psilocybe cf. subviscida]|uniref:EF-hand domain-containing protein n=1 Tax=Psilocybe cf. subviscida TaxID=2480587 RepID=A0A8H5B1B6_9AGAR|nr:hypothetical protein D9619_011959 [Psilocybe cf. subviscida]